MDINMTANISIHALHEESDPDMTHDVKSACREFQSTLSMRRATRTCGRHTAAVVHFNPRSP